MMPLFSFLDAPILISWCPNSHFLMPQFSFPDAPILISWYPNSHFFMPQFSFPDAPILIYWCPNSLSLIPWIFPLFIQLNTNENWWEIQIPIWRQIQIFSWCQSEALGRGLILVSPNSQLYFLFLMPQFSCTAICNFLTKYNKYKYKMGYKYK